jgi:hypothetical protein
MPSARGRARANQCDQRGLTTARPNAGTASILTDPDDDKFLDAAINGEADCIVTGDVDLLTLDPFHGVRILTPRHSLGVPSAGPDWAGSSARVGNCATGLE